MMNNENQMWPSIYRPVTFSSSLLLPPYASLSLHHYCLLADSSYDIRTALIDIGGLSLCLPGCAAAVSGVTYPQALPPRPGTLQENMGFIHPIDDAVLLFAGICITKLMSFNIYEFGMIVFVSISNFLSFFFLNS